MGPRIFRRRSLHRDPSRESPRDPLHPAKEVYRQRSTRRRNLPAPMNIPFTKAHGARNDFLITPSEALSPDLDRTALARAICDRHTGAGADGWIILSPAAEADAAI